MSDKEAKEKLEHMRWQAGSLFRLLDQDGDGRLSPAELDAAPAILGKLAKKSGGVLRDKDIGGPTLIPGLIRRSAIVRLLDEDGDLVIRADDIADATNRLRRLDRDGDGYVTELDDLPILGNNRRMPMGTPSDRLAYQTKMFTRAADVTGPLPPKGHKNVQSGYLLIQEVNDRGDVQKSNRALLMDEHGNIVHQWHTDNRLPEATVCYLLPDGNLLRTTCEHDWLVMDGQFPIGTHGNVQIQDTSSKVLWEWTHFKPGDEALHHDVEMMPNGNILVLSWSAISKEAAIEYGWTPQGERDFLWMDKIYEIKPDLATGSTEIVWQWSALDHIVQQQDAKTEESRRRIDLNWPHLDTVQFNANQILHLNSVSYNAEEDLILISSAIFGEIWLIDHSTTTVEAASGCGGKHGKGGDILWRYGNPQTHSNAGPEHQLLYWQHDAHFLGKDLSHGGDILVFNNGMRRDANGKADYRQICMGLISGAYSDVYELKLPRNPNGSLAFDAPPEVVWSFNKTGDVDFYSPFMSGARRMPNGNTLMMQACDKRIVEISEEGELVLDFHVGGPGRMFRVNKYSADYEGLTFLGLDTNQPFAKLKLRRELQKRLR